MYTLVRARPQGHPHFCWTGHVYDVSSIGMRFELDELIEPGTLIQVRAMLPGAKHITIEATGRVVRLHDDRDELGPMRMGMTFEHMAPLHQVQLATYLSSAGLKEAA